MKFYLCTLLLFSNLIGCSTTHLDSPPSEFENLPPNTYLKNFENLEKTEKFLDQIIKRAGSQGSLWWAKYKKAQLNIKPNPLKSCQLFSQLAKDSQFPLRDVAAVRSWQVCEDPSVTAHLPTLAQLQKKSWLRSLVSLARLEILGRSSLLSNKMDAYIQKSKRSRVLDEKVILTQKALQLARQLGRSKSIKLYSKRLEMLQPRFIKKPNPSQFLKIAYDYRKVRDFKTARIYYRKALKSRKLPHRSKISALKGIRITYKIENHTDNYLKATEDLASYTRTHYFKNRRSSFFRKNYVESHTLLAKTYWTKGYDKKAQKVLTGLARTMRKYPQFIPQFYWIIGRIHEERAHFDTAIFWFKKALSINTADHVLNKKLHWYLAWNLKRVDKYEQAVKVFEDGLGILKKDDQHTKAKFEYWLADTYQKKGETKKAVALFETLKINDPIGYYGLLAHRATHSLIKIQPQNRQPAQLAVQLNQQIPWYKPNYLLWAMSLEEDLVSLKYIKKLSRTLRRYRKTPTPVNEFKRMLKLYSKAGHYQTLLLELATLPENIKEDIQLTAPGLFFPRPFESIVKTKSYKNQIRPALVYAIMRQESAFNKNARSPADAFGLMQILPKVASRTARKNDIPLGSTKDLYRPKTNIAIGSALIKSLLEKHQGQFIPAVASYNAAESAIEGWFKTRYRGISTDFIEDIPYEETRNYLKLVLRNMVFYSLLNSDKSEMYFPEWAFELNSEPFKTALNRVAK